jgi:hypothetical protein
MERFEIRATSIAKCDTAERIIHDMAVRHAKARAAAPSYAEKVLTPTASLSSSSESLS